MSNNRPYYLIALVWLGTELAAEVAFAETEIPEACAEYSDFLSARELGNRADQLDASDCIPYEKLVISSEGWRSFIWNFERHFSKDGYPVQIYKTLKAWKSGSGGLALLHLDAASSSMHQVFAKTGDRERGASYFYLLTRLRNKVLQGYISDRRFFAELAALEKPPALSSLDIPDDQVEAYLVCLVQLDAWTEQFSKLVDSVALENCVENTSEAQ